MQGNVFVNAIGRVATRKPARKQHPRKSILQRFVPLMTPIFLLILWQVVAMLEVFPVFIIPPPISVAEKLRDVAADGRLWLHAGTTLQEVLIGLGFGVTIGIVLGYLIAKIPVLEKLLSPIIVAFQATPILAYAPLLVIWFGTGITSKVLTGALVVFFPMLMNTVVGIRSVPLNLRDLMRASRATRWQMFAKLEIPAAMPVLITGLKTSATLAVIGAVVGEFVTASSGLGFWVKLARDQYDTPLVFVAVLALTTIALMLYGLVSLLERHMLAWQMRSHRN